VLTCYLDDSGKDPQNPITTVAGYIAREDAWQAFEQEVEPIFAERQVSILHAKDLRNTDGDFKNMSALKRSYQEHALQRAAATPSRRTVTPYTFCFQVVVDWILRDVRIGRAANTEGVALVLEDGHENNGQAEREFHWVRKHYGLENVLHSIRFEPKESCRAIQYANLLAFYSRRDGVALLKAQNDSSEAYEMDIMLKIILEGVPHRGFVATGFHDRQP
jgi:hypothetical protein